MRDAFKLTEDANSVGSEPCRKLNKSGSSVKWLSKLLPKFLGKCKNSSAVVAPAPDTDFECELHGEAESSTARSIAWQAVADSHDVASSDEAQALENSDGVANSESSQALVPKSHAPVPVPAALARSSAISAALAADVEALEPEKQQVLTWQEWKETRCRDSDEPLPIELLDEPKGLVVKPADLDIETLLPPLPARDHELGADENLPGFAANSASHDVVAELERGLREMSHSASESRQVRRRPSSYRSTDVTCSVSRLTQETLALPQKLHGAPQKDGRNHGVCSLSSRPTTAGEDISVPWSASHQSTSSSSWPDQSAAGVVLAHLDDRATPSLRVAALSAGSKSPRVPCQRPESAKETHRNALPIPPPPPPPQPPPPAQPGSMDPSFGRSANNPMFVAALMRACESANARTATPPDISRRKHLLELAQRAREEACFLDEDLAEAESIARKSSKDSVARQFDKRPEFSELAVSFASLNDDM
eukprot:TRINITY_DN73078_c0_g1_i1.p1 TRINITY_DN73078_c0_g1~~TRINITY_DN73078_c0_g1_i1.p1  ORF type:complete len:480 (-),score=85.30 TRINITY_DN73078_c0_g1_i1:206-1645(-)